MESLEFAVAQIMIPSKLWEDYFSKSEKIRESNDSKIRDYKEGLNQIAFSKTPSFGKFKIFLEENRIYFGKNYYNLIQLAPDDLLYVFKRIREEREAFAKENSD